jgi:hypothetical protein
MKNINFFHSLRLSISLSFSSKIRNGDRQLFFFRFTGRLSGWIRLLLVSITTMKSINTSGAPSGTRRSNIYFVFCTYPKIISLILQSVLSGSFQYRFMRIIRGNYFVEFSGIMR